MENKKIEVSSIAITLLSFTLIFFGFMEGVLLLLGYSILIEKDIWLTRQVLQALYLRILYLVTTLLIGWLFKGIVFIFDVAGAYKGIEYTLKIESFMEGTIYIALFIFIIIGALKLLRGQDASIPIVNSFAAKTLGEKTIKDYNNKSSVKYKNLNSNLNENIADKSDQEDLANQIAKNTTGWKCGCETINYGNFCVTCGKKKEDGEVSD